MYNDVPPRFVVCFGKGHASLDEACIWKHWTNLLLLGMSLLSASEELCTIGLFEPKGFLQGSAFGFQKADLRATWQKTQCL